MFCFLPSQESERASEITDSVFVPLSPPPPPPRLYFHPSSSSSSSSSRTYHALCSKLGDAADELCDGRAVFLLEGGYDLTGLSSSFADSVRGLLSLPSLDKFDKAMLADEPGDKVRAAVAEARRIHGL